MNFTTVTIIASVIIWIFPAFRQFKSNLFYYFLLLALADPTAYLFFVLFKINTSVTHSVFGGILLLYSVDFDWNRILKNWIVNLAVVVAFVTALFLLSNLILLIIVCHFLILSKFVKHIIIQLHGLSEINSFYLVLVFYELTILVNFIGIVDKTTIGFTLHYITLSFQLLIAIFFILFRSDNKSLVISLKPAT